MRESDYRIVGHGLYYTMEYVTYGKDGTPTIHDFCFCQGLIGNSLEEIFAETERMRDAFRHPMLDFYTLKECEETILPQRLLPE